MTRTKTRVVRGGTGGGTGWGGTGVVRGWYMVGWYGGGTGWVVRGEGTEIFSLTFTLTIIRDLYQNKYYSTYILRR